MRALPWTVTSQTGTRPTSRRAASVTPRRRAPPGHPETDPLPPALTLTADPHAHPHPHKALELSGILRNGVVAPEFVSHPDLP